MVSTWMEALKIYNKGKAWCVYKKGSKEYDEVRKIQDKIKRPGEKANLQKPVAKKEIVSIPKKKVKKVDAPEQESRRVDPLPCPSKDIDPDKLECRKKFLLKLAPDKNTGCPDEAKEKIQKFIERCKFGSEGSSDPLLGSEEAKAQAPTKLLGELNILNNRFREVVKTLRKYKKDEDLPQEDIKQLKKIRDSTKELENKYKDVSLSDFHRFALKDSIRYMNGVFSRLRRKHNLPKNAFV